MTPQISEKPDMTTTAPLIRGAGGKGGGGAPREAPDDLFSDGTAYIIDVISEGPIEGWADPDNPARCIFFDGTPLENADGSVNFDGVDFTLRTGTDDQAPVPGFSAVENEIPVSSLVENAAPVARNITNADADALRVTVSVPTLLTITDNGDRDPASVEYAIEVNTGGGWSEAARETVAGKTTSGAGFQRATRIELPPERPVQVRVRRITADSATDQLTDSIFFASYTEIIDAKLSYPNTAYVALAIPADAFGGRLPTRSYKIRGMQCLAPSNYDPVARTYSGLWDGTFQRAWTRNPAWALYTALVQGRWGLGDRIDASRVDRYAFYNIATRCDELVDDGAGGQEPRYSIDGPLADAAAAYDVVRQLSTIFPGGVMGRRRRGCSRRRSPARSGEAIHPGQCRRRRVRLVVDGAAIAQIAGGGDAARSRRPLSTEGRCRARRRRLDCALWRARGSLAPALHHQPGRGAAVLPMGGRDQWPPAANMRLRGGYERGHGAAGRYNPGLRSKAHRRAGARAADAHSIRDAMA